MERLLERLKRWGVRLSCADGLEAYAVPIPQGLLYVGKEDTTIKRDHAGQPHWLVRIGRRSIIVPETRRRGTPAWPFSPASLARPASAISYLCWPKTLPRPATKPSIRVQTPNSFPS